MVAGRPSWTEERGAFAAAIFEEGRAPSAAQGSPAVLQAGVLWQSFSAVVSWLVSENKAYPKRCLFGALLCTRELRPLWLPLVSQAWAATFTLLLELKIITGMYQKVLRAAHAEKIPPKPTCSISVLKTWDGNTATEGPVRNG